MKTGFLIIILNIFTGFHLNEESDLTGNWKLVRNEDGIKAFTREVEGSSIKQVRVIANVKSTLTAPVAIVRDVSSHQKWIYRCKTAKILKTVSESDHYYYNETEAPWPISNRDIITHAVITQDKKSKIVTITSTGVPNFIPPIKDIVRLKKLQAQWKFIPKVNGTVDINFTLLIDLGGDLPSWLVNLAIADGPFETVLNMRKEVVKPKYQNAVYNFIKEL
ncbi:MAG: START domain-containing protein [Bacteroidales bacterium]|nr:START domain-containing protein [Bacteroidales bacterium]